MPEANTDRCRPRHRKMDGSNHIERVFAAVKKFVELIVRSQIWCVKTAQLIAANFTNGLSRLARIKKQQSRFGQRTSEATSTCRANRRRNYLWRNYLYG
jgi:hypothetical protein